MNAKATKQTSQVDVEAQQSNTGVTESVNPDAGFTFLIDKGHATKLSPKSTGTIFFQLAVCDADKTLHVRISGNEGGGLHSKEWVSLNAVMEVLKTLKDQSFKSSVFKKVMVGKSSNNVSFLSGILRSTDIGLIQPSPDGTFLHQLAPDFELKYKNLKALVR